MIYKFLFLNGLIIFLLFIAFTLKGINWGISSLLGGMISLVPSLIFILIFFRNTPKPQKIVSSLYLAEFLKWIFTLILFTVVFQWSNLKPVPLFVTFIATQLVYWLILFINP